MVAVHGDSSHIDDSHFVIVHNCELLSWFAVAAELNEAAEDLSKAKHCAANFSEFQFAW